jgi:hypothetical protein
MSSNAELLTDTGLSDEQAEIVVDIIGAGQEARLVIQRLGGLVDPVGT